MKVLKIIGIIVAVLAVVIIAIGLIAPHEYKVERTTTIDAPIEVVYRNVSDLHEFEKWNPWSKKDPQIVVEHSGEPGTVGSNYHWKGNDKVGEGSMTITAVDPGKRIDQRLDFIKPFASTANVYFIIEPAGSSQKVSWGMTGKSGFVSRVFMTLMGGMEKAIGPDYDKGIQDLKQKAEAEAATAATPAAATIPADATPGP